MVSSKSTTDRLYSSASPSEDVNYDVAVLVQQWMAHWYIPSLLAAPVEMASVVNDVQVQPNPTLQYMLLMNNHANDIHLERSDGTLAHQIRVIVKGNPSILLTGKYLY